MATKRLNANGEPVMSGKGGAVLSGGGGTGGGSQTGSNWTNMSQYLDANKGAGAGMASDITKGAQESVNKIEGQGGEVDAWQTSANKQIDDATRKDTYSDTIKNGSTEKVAAIDTEAYGAWNKLGDYWGDIKNSSQTTGYDETYKNAKNTKDTIGNLNSYDGQKAALQKTYGQGGGYGKGFSSLDSFALNGDASGQQALQDFQTNNANFGQKFDKTSADITAYAGGAAARGKGIYDKTVDAAKARYSSVYDTGVKAQGIDADSIYTSDLAAARAKAPTDNSLTGNTGAQYVTRNMGDAQAYLDPNGLAALNKLSGIDDQDDTNELDAGVKASSGLNWQALAQYAPSVGPGSIAPQSKTPTQFSDGSSVDESGYTPPEKAYNKELLRPARR